MIGGYLEIVVTYFVAGISFQLGQLAIDKATRIVGWHLAERRRIFEESRTPKRKRTR